MSSSDSDCDYFNNATQKLQQLKQKYRDPDLDLSDLICDTNHVIQSSADILKASRSIVSPTDDRLVKPTNTTTGQSKRGRKKGKPAQNKQKDKTDVSTSLLDNIDDLLSSNAVQQNVIEGCTCSNNSQNGSRSIRYSRRCKKTTALKACPIHSGTPDISLSDSMCISPRVPTVCEMLVAALNRRGRNSTRSKRGRNARSKSGRNRSRNIRTRNAEEDHSIPTFNIGIFENYIDQSASVSLFSKPHHKTTQSDKTSEIKEDIKDLNTLNSCSLNTIDNLSVIEIDNGVYSVSNKFLDTKENQDEQDILNVKVQWQSDKIYIFKLKISDDLSMVYDFFKAKENSALEKMLFTYCDKILQPEDTLESVNYNIAKIIDGGILYSSHPEIYCDKEQDNCQGIDIKFQFKGIKKLYETKVARDNILIKAMTKCADHIKQPLSKLQFELDGDIITGDMTPSDLDLEGGECIDVKIKL